MHGPWHMPEHPDEADISSYERELEEAELMARLEAHADLSSEEQPNSPSEASASTPATDEQP